MADELDAALRALDASRAREASLDARVAELQDALVEAERRLARIGEVELERDEARAEILELERRVEVLTADVASRDELLERSRRVHDEMLASVSWRVTSPLRALKRGR